MWIKPLQYGDVIEAYQNRERDAGTLAFLFRRSVVGFEHTTPHSVRMMPMWAPTELETAVIKASDLVEDTTPEEQAEQAGVEEIPEDSIWAKHNRDTRGQAKDTVDDMTDADLMHNLHELGETQESIYKMLVQEIQLLFEGAERHQARVEKDMKKNQKSSGSSRKTRTKRGSRTDRAAQVFGR